MAKAKKEAVGTKDKAAKPDSKPGSKQVPAQAKGKRKASQEQNVGAAAPGQASPSPVKHAKAASPKKRARTEAAAAAKASPAKAPKPPKQATSKASKEVLTEGDLLPSVVMRRNDGEQVNIQVRGGAKDFSCRWPCHRRLPALRSAGRLTLGSHH